MLELVELVLDFLSLFSPLTFSGVIASVGAYCPTLMQRDGFVASRTAIAHSVINLTIRNVDVAVFLAQVTSN